MYEKHIIETTIVHIGLENILFKRLLFGLSYYGGTNHYVVIQKRLYFSEVLEEAE